MKYRIPCCVWLLVKHSLVFRTVTSVFDYGQCIDANKCGIGMNIRSPKVELKNAEG